MREKHREFKRTEKSLGTMSFENPAVCYCLLETNQIIDRAARARGSSKFYGIMSEVIYWERVEQLPVECDEYYHVQISILGKTCVMDVEIGRRSSICHCGFIKVNFIDDTD